MRICVYCSSAPEIDPSNLELAHSLGKGIAERGWELVWGGGQISMMGAVARGAREAGGRTIGVIPTKLLNVEFVDRESSEIIEVENMRTRKAKLEELSDAFITLPGGIGTLEEFFEIWVGRYLGFHEKPISVLDPAGDFMPLQTALQHLEEKKFMKNGQTHLVSWTTQVNEALDASIK
ncbi:MAG: hypothetical protein RL414_992 [Actinomycetota bacterium]